MTKKDKSTVSLNATVHALLWIEFVFFAASSLDAQKGSILHEYLGPKHLAPQIFLEVFKLFRLSCEEFLVQEHMSLPQIRITRVWINILVI